MTRSTRRRSLRHMLDRAARDGEPGLQYVVVDANGTLLEHAGGWADIQNQKPMTLETTMMGYSMTKTLTAVTILQLVERGQLSLDEGVDRFLPNGVYRGHGITVRHLLDHTSGVPNPIPLRWVHLAREDANFDEGAALSQVLRDNPNLAFAPGRKFLYTNIGYWLLGEVLRQIAEKSYRDYARANVLSPLNLSSEQMDFVIPNEDRHAKGYLAKYSLLNVAKGLVTDTKLWGGYEGRWLRLKSHYVNGPSFGGLVGTARGFARFLQDQLGTASVLFNPGTKRLLETPQVSLSGKPIPMTLGWHLGATKRVAYFFKEGGGGGFHSEMRLYPAMGIGSVVMVNRTAFQSTKFLNRMDTAFHPA